MKNENSNKIKKAPGIVLLKYQGKTTASRHAYMEWRISDWQKYIQQIAKQKTKTNHEMEQESWHRQYSETKIAFVACSSSSNYFTMKNTEQQNVFFYIVINIVGIRI